MVSWFLLYAISDQPYAISGGRRATDPLFSGAARLPTPPRANVSVHDVAVYAARILVRSGGETDLIAVQPPGNGRGDIAGPKGTGNHLESLFERKFSLRQLPSTIHLRRHDPKISRTP